MTDALTMLRDVFISFLVAVTLSGLYVSATHRRGRRKGLFWLFLILFAGTAAGSLWIKPLGAAHGGMKWLQVLVIGAILALLLAVLFPRRPPRGRRETLDQLEEISRGRELQNSTYVALGVLFWLVLALLIIAVIIRLIIGY